MIIDGNFVFIGLVILAGALTAISLKVSLILFRLGASIIWLVLGLLLLTNRLGIVTSTNTSTTENVTGNVTSVVSNTTSVTSSIFGEPWSQALGLAFLVMTIAPLTLQFSTEIKHEKEGITWLEWGKKPTDNKPTGTQQVKERHKERLRSIRERRQRR